MQGMFFTKTNLKSKWELEDSFNTHSVAYLEIKWEQNVHSSDIKESHNDNENANRDNDN